MSGFAQTTPSIQVSVRLVTAAFTVRDHKGALLSNLGKDDFEVLDDGVPQSISFFSHSADLPLSLGLVVDASGSQQHFMKRHDRDLKRFLTDVIGPRDRAFLLCFGNHLRLPMDFTNSPERLLDGLARFEHEKNRGEMPELGPPELRLSGTAFYDAQYFAAAKLAGEEHGRRALIVFSDGEDNSSAHHMLDVIEAAQTGDVLIFGIRYTERMHGRITARNKYGTSVMARLGRETGGADFDAQNDDLREAFREIGEQIRSSYELAYHPAGVASDGTFHKLVIRARRPDLVVRAKTGYFARQ